ncbi:MAG: peptidyl-prolyl cis-trans isomerase [Novosphingobium sp.]
MLQIFRKSLGSKLGAGVALGFLLILGLAFAAGDIAGNKSFGGVAGGDRAATVGKGRVDTSEVERAVSRTVENLRREQPTASLKDFIAQGGFEQVLRNVIDLTAISEFGSKHGMHIGNRLIDSEIVKLPDVQGPDGKVSDTLYKAFLQQRGLTDGQLRRELGNSLMARQLLTTADIGTVVPAAVVQRYAAIVMERRTGQIGLLPSAAFAPKTLPGDAELATWYAANQKDFILPERRVIRYATFSDAVLKTVPAPTEAEIAAAYNANKARFEASESRKVSQLILPTEAAAKAALAESAGKSLEAVAAAKGLSVATLAPLQKSALAIQTSQAAANAAFAGAKGKVLGPIKAPLGWVLLRVDSIEGKAGKTLDQARSELLPDLIAQKRRAALTDFSARIEEEFDNGANLADVAKELGLTLKESAPLLSNGQVFGQTGTTAPAELARVVSAAFSMESEGQPQLAEIEAGKQFIVFDVSQLQPSAAPPLAAVKPQVLAEYQLAKGAAAARTAALKIEGMLKQGGDLNKALASLGLPLPPVDQVDLPREKVQQMGQQTPPPVAMLFSIAKGQVKLMAAPRNRGWYVVKVIDVIPGQIAANDPRLPQFAQTMARVTAQEYSLQLRAAMRADVGVKRNEAAINALKTRLSGGN